MIETGGLFKRGGLIETEGLFKKGGLIQTGGLFKRGGLFNLEVTTVSVPHKELNYKVESSSIRSFRSCS